MLIHLHWNRNKLRRIAAVGSILATAVLSGAADRELSRDEVVALVPTSFDVPVPRQANDRVRLLAMGGEAVRILGEELVSTEDLGLANGIVIFLAADHGYSELAATAVASYLGSKREKLAMIPEPHVMNAITALRQHAGARQGDVLFEVVRYASEDADDFAMGGLGVIGDAETARRLASLNENSDELRGKSHEEIRTLLNIAERSRQKILDRLNTDRVRETASVNATENEASSETSDLGVKRATEREDVPAGEPVSPNASAETQGDRSNMVPIAVVSLLLLVMVGFVLIRRKTAM